MNHPAFPHPPGHPLARGRNYRRSSRQPPSSALARACSPGPRLALVAHPSALAPGTGSAKAPEAPGPRPIRRPRHVLALRARRPLRRRPNLGRHFPWGRSHRRVGAHPSPHTPHPQSTVFGPGLACLWSGRAPSIEGPFPSSDPGPPLLLLSFLHRRRRRRRRSSSGQDHLVYSSLPRLTDSLPAFPPPWIISFTLLARFSVPSLAHLQPHESPPQPPAAETSAFSRLAV